MVFKTKQDKTGSFFQTCGLTKFAFFLEHSSLNTIKHLSNLVNSVRLSYQTFGCPLCSKRSFDKEEEPEDAIFFDFVFVILVKLVIKLLFVSNGLFVIKSFGTL